MAKIYTNFFTIREADVASIRIRTYEDYNAFNVLPTSINTNASVAHV